MSNGPRRTVPPTVEMEVLSRSRRRCCICFGLNKDLDVKQGQIAHLDRNRSNNAIDNLAFLCLPHHDQYDSRTSQSKSFLSSEVKKYRDELYRYLDNWSERYSGVKVESDLQAELRDQVLLEISLIPHWWKNRYMAKYPGHFRDNDSASDRTYIDVWDKMIDVATHKYSTEEWTLYLPLFKADMHYVIDRLERILMSWGEAVPTNLKLAILRTSSQLNVEAGTYRALPSLFGLVESADRLFSMRFKEVLTLFAELSRLAENERPVGS